MFLRCFSLVAFFFLSLVTANAYVLPPPNCAYDKFEGCLKEGRLPYLVIFGEIVISDASLFTRIDKELARNAAFPIVYLDSGGGNLAAAVGIGRILRKNEATVRSENPVLGRSNTECSSACVMVAAGATKRYLTHIGLHSGSKMTPNMEKVAASDALDRKSRNYFDEMGIDERLSLISEAVPFTDMLDLRYDPSLIGSSQYIIQFGFYQGDVHDTDDPDREGLRFAPYIPYAQHEQIAAENGSPAALAALIDRLMNGLGKTKPDPSKAIEWLHLGLERGDARSAHNLAWYYSTRDKAKSISIYMRAAEMGSAASQNNLGWAYYKGNGVKRSITDAVFWITKSAEQGEPFAYGSLCEMAADGNIFHNNNVQAFKWCHLALWEMPEGKARDASVAAMAVISKRMTEQERVIARQVIEDWEPLKPTRSRLGNKEDRVKPQIERWLNR